MADSNTVDQTEQVETQKKSIWRMTPCRAIYTLLDRRYGKKEQPPQETEDTQTNNLSETVNQACQQIPTGEHGVPDISGKIRAARMDDIEDVSSLSSEKTFDSYLENIMQAASDRGREACKLTFANLKSRKTTMGLKQEFPRLYSSGMDLGSIETGFQIIYEEKMPEVSAISAKFPFVFPNLDNSSVGEYQRDKILEAADKFGDLRYPGIRLQFRGMKESIPEPTQKTLVENQGKILQAYVHGFAMQYFERQAKGKALWEAYVPNGGKVDTLKTVLGMCKQAEILEDKHLLNAMHDCAEQNEKSGPQIYAHIKKL
ncbi:hypothetical protein ACFL96_15315 [Thermoproteota archaeon]